MANQQLQKRTIRLNSSDTHVNIYTSPEMEEFERTLPHRDFRLSSSMGRTLRAGLLPFSHLIRGCAYGGLDQRGYDVYTTMLLQRGASGADDIGQLSLDQLTQPVPFLGVGGGLLQKEIYSPSEEEPVAVFLPTEELINLNFNREALPGSDILAGLYRTIGR